METGVGRDEDKLRESESAFLEIPFKEDDARIELASELLFANALGPNGNFGPYFRLILATGKQSDLTRLKFFNKLIDLCDREVSSRLAQVRDGT